MKRITLIIAFIYFAFNANAIEITTGLNRIITVTGSAEIIIPPDEIELEITLTENNSWKSLSKIELAFMKLLFGNDIEKDRIVFNSTNSSFYWYYWWYHRNDSRKSKKIVLKLDAKTNFMKLVRDLDKEYVTSIRITKTSNKDLQKYRREVKIEAIKAAKDKATYLLEAVDEEVGRLMQVDELQVIDNNQYWGQQNTNMVRSNSIMSYSKTRGSYIENVPEIKLRYEVKTIFEIK
ncbi:MAG: hypothetical protein COA97_05530 [Flavobacteriales bacterium]|nr:MAG: hypothetical protein COA97_05530 [Flavobacteriales bacterium]